MDDKVLLYLHVHVQLVGPYCSSVISKNANMDDLPVLATRSKEYQLMFYHLKKHKLLYSVLDY